MKYVFVHAVIGDYSWISCAGVNDDEAVLTAGVVLVRGCRLVRSPWSRCWVCFVWLLDRLWVLFLDGRLRTTWNYGDKDLLQASAD